MSFNFLFLGNLEVKEIQNKLNSLDWEYFTYRQTVHKVHKQTLTVPLLFDPSFGQISLHKDFGLFINDLEKIKKVFSDKLGKGFLQSAILINLPAGKEVVRHVDKSEVFKNFHRVHVPIQTNEQCFFEVDGEVISMKEGEIWEINNSEKAHSVQNKGESDRIHLLMDWRVKD